MKRPELLYHGSTRPLEGALEPVLKHGTEDHVHEKPAVFATARKDLAALFMFPMDVLASIGFEEDTAYICIWGTEAAYRPKDRPGYLHALPSEGFEQVGKGYEWQALEAVTPIETETYDSALDGMLANGVRVWFVDDEALFDRIVAEKDNRLEILKDVPYLGK